MTLGLFTCLNPGISLSKSAHHGAAFDCTSSPASASELTPPLPPSSRGLPACPASVVPAVGREVLGLPASSPRARSLRAGSTGGVAACLWGGGGPRPPEGREADGSSGIGRVEGGVGSLRWDQSRFNVKSHIFSIIPRKTLVGFSTCNHMPGIKAEKKSRIAYHVLYCQR